MTSTASPPTTVTAPARLSGSLGPVSIVLMVVAAAAPLTVMAGSVPIGVAFGTGAAFPAMFVVAALVLFFFAVGYVAMTPHVTTAGAFYSYVQRGLGRPAGLAAAFGALFTYVAVQGAVFGFFGAAAGDLVTSYGGPSLPWWLWSALAWAVVALLGYRNIELSSSVLGLLLIAEIGVVVVLDAAVLGGGGGPHGVSTATFDAGQVFSGAPGLGLMFAIGGFIGFEATAIFRDEARDPEKTIPRATYGALALIGVFYAVSSWAIVSAWGDGPAVEEATTNTGVMLVDTARGQLGTVGADVVQILLVTSIFACTLSFHNVISRYLHALAGIAVLPAALGRRHPRHSSPHAASLVSTVVAAVLLAVCAIAGLDPVTQVFAWLAGIATVGVIVLMLLACLAVLVFFRWNETGTGLWPSLIAPGLGLVGLAACLVVTLQNVTLLVGGSGTLAAVLLSLLAACFLAGVVVSFVRPAVEPASIS